MGRALALVALVAAGSLCGCRCRQDAPAKPTPPAPAGEARTWWEDRDGDGFGDPRSTIKAARCPAFHADPSRGADCADALSTVNPTSCDVAGNGRDEDCSGADGPGKTGGEGDQDRDGYNTKPGFCSDCNDRDPKIHPGAKDPIGDGVDQNCDGRDGPLPLRGADKLKTGQLVITELFLDRVNGDGRDEWFEVFNASGARLRTEGLQLRDGKGGAFTVERGIEVRAFGLVVFARRAGRFKGSQVYSGVRLRPKSSLEIRAGGRTIDRVDWSSDRAFPFEEGASTTLYPWFINHSKNDLGKSWCPGRSRGYFKGLGTPGQENDLCIPRADPGTAWPARDPPPGG